MTRRRTALRSSGLSSQKRVVEPLQPRVIRLRRCLRPIERGKDPEPLARALLQPVAADRGDEHVACDRVEPRRRRAVRTILEAGSREPRLREGLGRQVERGIVVARPAELEAVDPLRVAVVQLPEGVCIGPCRREQLCVRSHVST